MAKKEKGVTTEAVKELAPLTKLTPAAVVGTQPIQIDKSLLPPELQNVEMEVVQTGFDPSVKWVNPGNFCVGVYQGFEEEVGPNNSKLYNFVAKDKPFGVWGTTVLDRAFATALAKGQIKPGYMLMITYVGDIPAEPQDCKMFHVAVLKKG